jgi:DNA-binding transcriptional regulator YhcF (GntR family)
MQTAKNKKFEIERNIIEKCFGNLEVNALNAFAHSCAKLIVKESSAKIVSGDFEMPSNSDMEEMIDKALEWDFDEDKVAAEIKRNYPAWSEERVYDEVDKLADIYEDERSSHLESIIKATVLECQNMVKELQKKTEA